MATTTFDSLPIGARFLCDCGFAYQKVMVSPGCNAMSASGEPCAFSLNYPVRPVGGES